VATRIEDYALIGDLHTCALVSNDGGIDWLCVPSFSDGAVFAALLGEPDHGHWELAPAGAVTSRNRHYREDTLVLETELTTASGTVRIIDFMPLDDGRPKVVRIVVGVRGTVPMRSTLRLRFDYGLTLPWVRRLGQRTVAIAGPNAMVLDSPVRSRGRGMSTVGEFEVHTGDRVPFVLGWHPSYEVAPEPIDAEAELGHTVGFWRRWIRKSSYDGIYQEPVERSLITLKALTYRRTGGLVAAATTSLPEQIGGERNWDYRYSWLRDSAFTLLSLLTSGYEKEARAWREWLLRAIAGDPDQLQIMYGLAGERTLNERTLPWLPGYEGSAPVRVGNAAVQQRQLDVYGEVLHALYLARENGLHGGDNDDSWPLQRALLDWLESHWDEPDAGIWEVRGDPQHFVHGKVMAWVAMDRAVRAVRDHGLPGPDEQWAGLRDQIHHDVCERGYSAERGSFVQAYDSQELDAATLLIPLVGFLPAHDERVVNTARTIERDLTVDGFVRRYETSAGTDGLSGSEGAFLMCTFWLADNLALQGRRRDARTMFERLLNLRNDVGLLAEEYDPVAGRQLGNVPQAFSHTAMVATARLLDPKGTSQWTRHRPGHDTPGH
jgi:GH15 family glucan-1,4-alpha-glucosidase